MKEMTGSRTGATALVDALEASGVRTIYGVPGEETTSLMAAINASGIEFVLCRHEQSAAFMASVEGRITGRPGVCLSTLGPGATNLVTGVADAQLDHVPLIAISGQGARDRIGRVSHQMIDLEALFRPVTKMSRNLLTADMVPASVAEAIRVSMEGRPGAVHLSLPEDVADAKCDMPLVALPDVWPGHAAPVSLALVAERLSKSERPVIVAGAGCVRQHGGETLRQFSRATNIPVAMTFMAKGLLPETDPLSLSTVGQPEEDYVDLALHAADLILAVGFDPVEYSAERLSGQGALPVCVVDAAAPVADAGWHVEAQAIGDISHSLNGIAEALGGRTWATVGTFQALREGMDKALNREVTPLGRDKIAAQDICRIVSQSLRDEDIVLSGVGLHKLWVARHVQPRRAGQLIVPNGLAGMGLALPGTVAAARLLKAPGRVLAICGDGDLMMNAQEMETITRHGLRVTVMVWDDGGYGLIDEHQAEGGPQFGFANPGWDGFAKAFGWTHARASTPHALTELLRAGLAAEGPTLLSVPVDYALSGGMPGVENGAIGASDTDLALGAAG